MKEVLIGLLILLLFLLPACSKEHTDLPTGFRYNPLPAPYDVTVEGRNEMAVISWRFSPEKINSVKEFRVYQYIEAYDMIQLIGVTADTVYTDSLLIGNLLYCYKVSAVDSSGFEGWRSAESCGFVLSGD